jgi:cysteine desulfurase/selenocysteine lyase
MFGLPGAGAAYFNQATHPELEPFLPGGGSAIRLRDGLIEGLTMPGGLEGGTPNLPGIIALGAAIDFISEVGLDRIATHVEWLTGYLIQRLRGVPGLTLLPGVAHGNSAGHGIVSLAMDGLRSDDLGFALASQGIYVRAGNHCLPDGNPYHDSVRVSLHLYNSTKDVDRLTDFLALVGAEAA